MLLAARFSADLKELFEVTSLFFSLEQLQNRDFAILNRSKPTRVLTRTKFSCSDGHLLAARFSADLKELFEVTSLFFFTTRSQAPILSQLKILRSKRDVVAAARFSNFKSL